MKYDDIEQLLTSAAATETDGSGLRTEEEAVTEFLRRIETDRNAPVPYWSYFFKSAAIIAIGFALLIFFCLNSGNNGVSEPGSGFRERMRLLSICVAGSVNYGEW